MSLHHSDSEQDSDAGNSVFMRSLAVLYDTEGPWQVNDVSPLYNLSYDAVSLKHYAFIILECIESAVPSNPSLQYSVIVDERFFLKYYDTDDSPLMITVLRSSDEGFSKIDYVAILMGWGASIKMVTATHMPYMLERGDRNIGKIVKRTLQTMFDCRIMKCRFTQAQLLKFGFTFLDAECFKGTENLTLTLKGLEIEPRNISERTMLTVVMEIAQSLWIEFRNNGDCNSDWVELLYNKLRSTIEHPLDKYSMFEVSLPNGTVKSNGMVKMNCAVTVNWVFCILNEINYLSSTSLYRDA